MHRRYAIVALVLLLLAGGLVVAATATPSARPLRAAQRGMDELIAVDADVVALVGVRVIDGTGAPAVGGQTVVIREGRIAAVGDRASVSIPEGAERIDGTGKTVFPGYVMVHEHLFYPAGGGQYNAQAGSFPAMYLAGGATTIRTGGSMVPYLDLNLRDAIEAGRALGPEMDVTGPYLNGPGLPILFVKGLEGPDDARRMVEYWADEGVTSFKAYMQISRAELGAAIEAAHARGIEVTGHLCSVTYREAADLGIDNLEHGFFAATDFVEGKEPDVCPRGARDSLRDLDPAGPEARALIEHLVERGVAVTSTLPVFETSVPGRGPWRPEVLDAMIADVREPFSRRRDSIEVQEEPVQAELFARMMAMEKAFADAGGLLIAGTDPTGYGGVVAGYSNQRAVELLVEAGFTPEEAIEVATRNGARYLERDDRVGSIAVGKQADLVLVGGNPSVDIAAVENVEIVFKRGVGYDSVSMFERYAGTVGLR